MVWQDIVISVVSVIFCFALLPQVVEGFKIKKGAISYGTSIPIFLGLLAIGYTYYTLSLHHSVALTLIQAVFWLILIVQRDVFSFHKRKT